MSNSEETVVAVVSLKENKTSHFLSCFIFIRTLQQLVQISKIRLNSKACGIKIQRGSFYFYI